MNAAQWEALRKHQRSKHCGDMTYQERKAARKEYYLTFVHGWKLRPCTACNGSGRYDNTGSPKCGGCNGSGKERYKPEIQHVRQES